MATALFILNCERYAAKRQKQLDTWLADPALPITYWFHVIGRPDQETEFAFDGHLLYVTCKDDYMSLPKKSYLAVKAIRTQYPDVQFILKTDDDMNCKVPALRTLLGVLPHFDYGGYIENHRGGMSDYHFQYVGDEEKQRKLVRRCKYANGRFYFLSQRAADHVLTQRDLFWESTFEDNTMGFAASTLEKLLLLHMRVDHTVFTEYTYVPPVHTIVRS